MNRRISLWLNALRQMSIARKNIIHPVTTLNTGEILRRSIWSFVSFEFCDSIVEFSWVIIYRSIAIASKIPIKQERRNPMVTIHCASRMRYRDGSTVSNIEGKIQNKNIFLLPVMYCRTSEPWVRYSSAIVLLENFFLFAILLSILFFSLLQVPCRIRLISSHSISFRHHIMILMWLDFFHLRVFMRSMREKNISILSVHELEKPMIFPSRIRFLWHDFARSKHSISRGLSFLHHHFCGRMCSISNRDFRRSICVHHLTPHMERSISTHSVQSFLLRSMLIFLLGNFLSSFMRSESESKLERNSRNIADRSSIHSRWYCLPHFRLFFIRNSSSKLRISTSWISENQKV